MSSHEHERCLAEVDLPDNGFDASELLRHIYQKTNEDEYVRSRGVYHPSSLSFCKRYLYYDRIEAPMNKAIHPNDLALFDVGHAIHEAVQSKYIQYLGESAFISEKSSKCAELWLEGSIDGIFVVEDWLLEIKTIGEASFNRLVKPKKEHITQLMCYEWNEDIPRGQILYINRNTPAQRRCFKVKFSMKYFRENVLDVIEYVEGCVEAETPPPQEINKYTCPSCMFFDTVCKPELDK